MIAIWILAWAGLGLCLELTRIYYGSYRDQNFTALCQISEKVDCKAVALSRYAILLGIPNSAYGMAVYFLLLVLIPFRLKSRVRIFKNLELYLAVLALISLVMTVHLAYASFFVLKKVCIWCTCLYAVDIAFLVLALLALERPKAALAQIKEDLTLLRADPRVLGGALAGAILLMVLLAILYSRSQRVRVFPEEGVAGNISISGDPVIGSSRARITIIEFSDFQCPSCRYMYQALKRVQEKHNPEIRVIVKNFPLDGSCNPMLKGSPHPNSCIAAMASECAHQLGVFEAFYDKLWTADNYSLEKIMGMAGEAGLDPNEFRNCMGSGPAQQEVLRDIQEAMKLKITGTPLLVINGHIIRSALSEAQLEELIQGILEGKEPVSSEE